MTLRKPKEDAQLTKKKNGNYDINHMAWNTNISYVKCGDVIAPQFLYVPKYGHSMGMCCNLASLTCCVCGREKSL